jgi:transcriptional regulator with XRE-family HTH domain
MKRHIALNPRELGQAIKSDRIALGRTQQDLATATGYRRQTIVDMEAGKNVSIQTLFAALAALGKGLRIVNTRPDLDQLPSLLDAPDED